MWAWWCIGQGIAGARALATIVVLPMVLSFWHLKYDALPGGLLVGGLWLAETGRWGLAGIAIGSGGAAKWFPLVALGPLTVGLMARREWPALSRLWAGATLSVAAFTVPFLGQQEALWNPYTFHSARGINGESLPFIVLRAIGVVASPQRPWFEVHEPGWAIVASLAFAVVVILVLSALALRRDPILLGAGAAAAFLLTNRIFSPQFILPLVLLWAFGLARTARLSSTRSWCLSAMLLILTSLTNYSVWPTFAAEWIWFEVVMFSSALTLTWRLLVPPDPGLRV